MSEAEYFHHKAATCTRMARACFDLATAGQLRSMATEFETRAAELEHSDAPQHDGDAEVREQNKSRRSH